MNLINRGSEFIKVKTILLNQLAFKNQWCNHVKSYNKNSREVSKIKAKEKVVTFYITCLPLRTDAALTSSTVVVTAASINRQPNR